MKKSMGRKTLALLLALALLSGAAVMAEETAPAAEEIALGPFLLVRSAAVEAVSADEGDVYVVTVQANQPVTLKQDPAFVGGIGAIVEINGAEESVLREGTLNEDKPSATPVMEPLTLSFDDTVKDHTISASVGEGNGGPESALYNYPLIFRIAEPDAPGEPPAAPASVTAVPNQAKVLVDGSVVSFDAYTINQNNYFKLRDLARALSGTGKQFEVTWDGANNTIDLISGKPYTVVGGELAQGDGTQKTAVPNASSILLDGAVVQLTAYTINQNNYFKLRDVGQAFDFNVSWDGASQTISIDTTTGYTPD